MNAVIQTLHYYYQAFLNSPHHLLVYAAVAALLLIVIPILRLIFRSRRHAEAASVEAPYPSMFGLNSPVDFQPDPVHSASEPPSIPPRNVTPINASFTIPCIHCGAIMSSRQDFCPACGYAQPMKQSFSA
jgi:hypothetical protein